MTAPAPVIVENTFIGGVAATIYTPQLLATKLAIDVSRITNFSVLGFDIKCKITGSYALPNQVFISSNEITFFSDVDGLVSSLGESAFYGTTKIQELEFKNCTSVSAFVTKYSNIKRVYLASCISVANSAFEQSASLIICYIPKVTSLGTTAGNNNVFFTMTLKIYAHPSLATNNAGNPDGDLTSQDVTYVTNFSVPNPITSLSVGNRYNEGIQLNFTASIGSVNAIDFYDVYSKKTVGTGVFLHTIRNGDLVSELTASTTYDFYVVARDVFFNTSTPVLVSTITTNNSWDMSVGLMSYYKLNEVSGNKAYDVYRRENLDNTGVLINQSGKVGTAYKATGSVQKLRVDNITPILTNFTLNCWVYIPVNQAGFSLPIQYGSYQANNGFGFYFNTSNQLSWRINQNYDHFSPLLNVPLNTWTMATMTYDGANVKMYINGVLKTTTPNTVNPSTAGFKDLIFRSDYSVQMVGSLDETSSYKTALTQTDIDVLYNLGNGTTL
jgi:hypothetical protein